MNESEEGANTLIDALFEKNICALLVQNLERLDESVKEESEGVHKTLGMSWNFMNVHIEILCLLTKLIVHSYFRKFNRIRATKSDGNRQKWVASMAAEAIES